MADRQAVNPPPTIDPTLLTTQQLLREMANLKEVIFTRLDGMDRAIVLFNENITRVPTDTDKQIVRLRELVFERFKVQDQKFDSVQTQFVERDKRTDQLSLADKTAVAAALQAAKEAVGKQQDASDKAITKSETVTTKLIDQLVTLIQTNTKSLDDKNADNKERVTRLESEKRGSSSAAAMMIAVGGLVVFALTALIMYVALKH
jgi:hypothetical protein